MIIKEKIGINNKEFIRHYSDLNLLIQKIGTEEIYSEAIDPIEYEREYIETDMPIEEENEEVFDEKN